ncbi:hypothetical protein P3T73_01395 [Kiritimatiellota bacterium B12222]|nr:hypothetical protein P3T73_01395 [Kiritimatiellota bacterium B12222]
MKYFILGMLTTLFLFGVLFVYLSKWGAKPRHDATSPQPLYEDWLVQSEQMAADPERGSVDEKAWIQKVERAFSPFTPESAQQYFPLAYAEKFYFRDAFHVFTERDEMVAYMVSSAEMSPGVTFDFSPVARRGIDFYLPWVMVLPSKSGGEPQRSVGLSHLRFNAEGQVIFHQDYWDSADVLVPKVPVANGLIELVRRRF